MAAAKFLIAQTYCPGAPSEGLLGYRSVLVHYCEKMLDLVVMSVLFAAMFLTVP